MDNFGATILTAFLGLISSIAAYFFGKRKKIDDIILEKGFPLAEQIVQLFQEITELETNYQIFYQMNFSGARSIQVAIDDFKRLPGLYQNDYENIGRLVDKRSDLYQSLKTAKLYLNNKILNDIYEYLEIGRFPYTTDGGIFIDTFYIDFFKNLIDTQNIKRRLFLKKRILNKLRKIIS